MYSGSMVALVTPMTQDRSLDSTALATLVQWHIDQGSEAIVVAGTTGESPTLTPSDRAQIYKIALEASAGKVPIIAGTGANSTAGTIELTQQAIDCGIPACLLVTPYYNKPGQAGLLAHFEAIANACAIPQLLYNVPSRTACDLLPETIAQLAKQANIIGIKEATGDLDRLQAIMNATSDDFICLSGDDGSAAEFMLAGGHGTISVTANVAPKLMRALCDAALKHDAVQARALDAELQLLHRRLFIESNPIPVKWALEKMLKIPSGALRLPLTPLLEAHQDSVFEALQAIGACQ